MADNVRILIVQSPSSSHGLPAGRQPSLERELIPNGFRAKGLPPNIQPPTPLILNTPEKF